MKCLQAASLPFNLSAFGERLDLSFNLHESKVIEAGANASTELGIIRKVGSYYLKEGL